ncbi:transcriptional regulator GcvA [Acinetobacter baumannii]|nr:transcriptional regulator GcvA [Acinetobacter baumannii]
MNSPVYLNALRAFEASARHKSFSAAAKELNVTPAAVGQLVRTLEDWLGFPLFHRQTNGKNRLVATELAESVLPDIRAGFDKLTLALEKLKQDSLSGMLNIAVSPAFAEKWLLPRIDHFQKRYPDVDIRLDINLKTVDFLEQKVDVGVRYGQGQWQGLEAVKLMDEEVYPVCSPTFLNEHSSLLTPNDLKNITLIHDLSMEKHQQFPGWQSWLKSVGLNDINISRGMQINSSSAVLQAAMEGHGVALARSVMVQKDIQTGRLIRLFPQIHFSSPFSYYLVYRPQYANLPKVKICLDWFFEEIHRI